MPTTTITAFQRLARDADGVNMPMAGGFLGSQTLTAAGSATALPDDTTFIRIATDTAYTSNVFGTGTSILHPAGSIDFFPAQAGQVITLTAVS